MSIERAFSEAMHEFRASPECQELRQALGLPPLEEVNMTIKTELKDVGERTAWTFAQAFLTVFVLTDTSTIRTAAVSAAAASLVVIKEYVKAKRAALS